MLWTEVGDRAIVSVKENLAAFHFANVLRHDALWRDVDDLKHHVLKTVKAPEILTYSEVMFDPCCDHYRLPEGAAYAASFCIFLNLASETKSPAT